jgi:EpsG family
MTAYFVVMLIICGMGLFLPHRFGLSVRTAAFVGLLIFCGLRLEVGPDWYSYLNYYDYIVSGYVDIGPLNEPAFTYLSMLSQNIGWGIVGVNLITACIFLTGLFSLVHRTPYPWCGLAVAFCYYIPALPMGLIRQAAAVGIIYVLLSLWARINLGYRVTLILAATMFHVSAIIMFALVLATLEINWWKRFTLGIVAAAVPVLVGIDPLNYFSVYNDRYIGGSSGVVIETTAALFQWLLVAFPALWYLLFGRNIEVKYMPRSLLLMGSLMAVGLIAVLPISSAAVTRLTLYFSFIPIVISGSFINKNHNSIVKIGLRISILGVSFVILSFWLAFAENSRSYKPYKNFITEDSIQQAVYTT